MEVFGLKNDHRPIWGLATTYELRVKKVHTISAR